MLNIAIPVGGKGSRFYKAGYTTYKPFLPVGDKTMIERVFENLAPEREHRFVMSIRPQDEEQMREVAPEGTEIVVDYNPQGAAPGLLLLREFIDNNDPLIIANSDQLVDIDINNFLDFADTTDGCIMTFPNNDSKWSYAVSCEPDGIITQYVVEKPAVPAGEATVGIYYWKRGSDFIRAVEAMMTADDRTNDDFYVCPAYNYLPRHKELCQWLIPAEKMHGLGTPEDYEAYLKSHSL